MTAERAGQLPRRPRRLRRARARRRRQLRRSTCARRAAWSARRPTASQRPVANHLGVRYGAQAPLLGRRPRSTTRSSATVDQAHQQRHRHRRRRRSPPGRPPTTTRSTTSTTSRRTTSARTPRRPASSRATQCREITVADVQSPGQRCSTCRWCCSRAPTRPTWRTPADMAMNRPPGGGDLSVAIGGSDWRGVGGSRSGSSTACAACPGFWFIWLRSCYFSARRAFSVGDASDRRRSYEDGPALYRPLVGHAQGTPLPHLRRRWPRRGRVVGDRQRDVPARNAPEQRSAADRQGRVALPPRAAAARRGVEGDRPRLDQRHLPGSDAHRLDHAQRRRQAQARHQHRGRDHAGRRAGGAVRASRASASVRRSAARAT